ncbi:MAG: biopolymer transporter ExbD [Opitutales bacterium]|nr:biopolymer transporter ExbD [Opitutales bacterium]
MAIGRRLASNEEAVRIDLSPMIDCVFILLIFFIVTTVFVEETGIEVNRPDGGGATSSQDQEIIEIKINKQGTVKFRGRDIGPQGVRGLIKQWRVNQPDVPVMINAEEKAPHYIFAEVYGEARMAGAEKISFK